MVAIDNRSTWTIQYMFYNMHHTSGSHLQKFYQIVKTANKIYLGCDGVITENISIT